jgi:hypothetical protein
VGVRVDRRQPEERGVRIAELEARAGLGGVESRLVESESAFRVVGLDTD